MAVQVQVFNLEGVMEAFFREFMSQPGGGQHFSQLLHSIRKGEPIGDLEHLSLPAGCEMRLSPRSSPHGSPLNPALLSPLFLPHSPRSPLTGGHCGALRTPTSSQSRFSRTYSSPHSPLARAVFKTVGTSQIKCSNFQDTTQKIPSTSRASQVPSSDTCHAVCVSNLKSSQKTVGKDLLDSPEIPIPTVIPDNKESLENPDQSKNECMTAVTVSNFVRQSYDDTASDVSKEKLNSLPSSKENSPHFDAIVEASSISGKSGDVLGISNTSGDTGPLINNVNSPLSSNRCEAPLRNSVAPEATNQGGITATKRKLDVSENTCANLLDNETFIDPEQERLTGACRVKSGDDIQLEICDQLPVVSSKLSSESVMRFETETFIDNKTTASMKKSSHTSKKETSASHCASDLSNKGSIKTPSPSLSNPRVNAALVSSLIAKFNSLEPDHCQSSISNVKDSLSDVSQVPSRVSCLVSQANCDGRFKGGRDSFECDKENLINVTDDAKKQSVMQSSLRQLGLQDCALREKSQGRSPKSRVIRSVRSPPSEVMVPSVHSKLRGPVSPPKIFVPPDTQTKPKICSVPFNASEKYTPECSDGSVSQRYKNKPRRRDYQSLADPNRADDRKKRQALILDDETVLLEDSTVMNDPLNAGFICSDDSTVSETVCATEPTLNVLQEGTPVSVDHVDISRGRVHMTDRNVHHLRHCESQSVDIKNVINVSPGSRNGRDFEEKYKCREPSPQCRGAEAIRTSTPIREVDACARPHRRPSEETLSPPPSGGISPAIAAAASTVSRHIEGSVPALPAPNEPRHQTYVRDPNLQDKPQTVFKASQSASGSTNGSSSSSAASSSVTAVLHNKENTRPGANVTSSLQHKSATPLTGSVFSTSSTSSGSSGAFGSTPSSPPHVPAAQPAVGRPSAPPTARRLAKTTSKNIIIPKFYFPQGRPSTPAQQEASIQRMASCFRDHGGQITKDQLDVLMRACDLPLYWKAPVFVAAGGEKLGYLTQELFTDYWSRVLSTCHDEASRFIHVLSRGTRNYILPEDFVGLIQDVVDSHPGLAFLKDAAEFHSRYVHTVIARIYYCVNRSWSGKITAAELRRSNLLSVISYLEDEEDINQITEYFSYEHFYVIYCKFWELDTDHDLFIDKNDLAKHNERALSMPIIERIFSGAVTRGRVQKQERMGYQEFVWFLISEEDKRHPTAIEYWFRCMDIDGDGFLSMYELEYFYEEQLQRMEALGIETLPFHDCLCQMLDMVRPEYPNKISLTDLKRCRMTPIFFDTFFNLEKYLDHEQRDPFASHRADDDGPEISDWDRFAAEEYELLVAEEGGTDAQDDLMYGAEDELSAGLEAVLARGDGVEGVGGEACTDSHAGSTSKQAGRSGMGGGALSKHSSLSATLTNLAVDAMDVDDDYADYADSDDYHY